MKDLLKTDVAELFRLQNPDARSDVVQESDLDRLPEPVRKYLLFTQIVGKPRVQTVRLKQNGRFRMNEKQGWMNLQAEEYFTIDPPGFVWYGRLNPFPLIKFEGLDRFYSGEGHFLIKLMNWITVVDSRGPELNASELLRYLSEIIWFPTAFLCDYITWEPLTDKSARATIQVGDTATSADLYFDDQDRLVNLQADRHRAVDNGYELARWSTPIETYGEMNGIFIPIQAQAVWNLDWGDLDYFDGGITEIEYDVPELY